MASEDITKQAIEEYRQFVASLANGNNGEGINRTFLNSDKEKALIVLTQLFKKAKKEILIFAGSLCHYVGTETEYIETLSDFIENEGKVRILLNKYNEEELRQSNLFKRLAYYQSEKRPIIVKSTNVRPYYAGDEDKNEVHFTIADKKGYRIETDIEKRTARCNFNNPKEAEPAVQFFDQIFNGPNATEINLLHFFNYGNK